jgi:hypothetical protein
MKTSHNSDVSIVYKKDKYLGYGNCPDCRWYKDPNGCNVKRDSNVCRLNRYEKKR